MLGDIGTTWAKIKDEEGNYHILPTKQILKEKWIFRKATGHLGKKFAGDYFNELEALGYGALKKIPENEFTVVDIGSRDTKFLKFRERKVQKLDWNQSCGASTGFTLELLSKYYEIKPEQMLVSKEKAAPITCAVFGMEKIFDSIIRGEKPEEALGRFISGIAYNVFEFALKPEKIYLSGGFCENEAFIKALGFYTQVVTLGRFVLLEGLS
ncbi:MAG TPA: ATPase [Spirochaetia bacterium]|nr:MAG: hypothetical protein A2Y41_09085 [Spirochaetes bacterium GWB1_36_13]HCL56431.1 ATPase [Spirochaetia bacterium]